MDDLYLFLGEYEAADKDWKAKEAASNAAADAWADAVDADVDQIGRAA